MTAIEVAPSGYTAVYNVNVPAPPGMSTIGGIQVSGVWGGGQAYHTVTVVAEIGGVTQQATLRQVTTSTTEWVALFPDAVAPAPLTLSVTFEQQEAEPGTTLSLTVRGAQTPDGSAVLNPDSEFDTTEMSDPVEVGSLVVLTWRQWNRLHRGS